MSTNTDIASILGPRVAATAVMMMRDSAYGHYELEDYGYAVEVAWFADGNNYHCDVSVNGNNGSDGFTLATAEEKLTALIAKTIAA